MLAALVATLPLVGLVMYAAVARYSADKARADTRATTRSQVFATLLAHDYRGRAPTVAELAAAVDLLPRLAGSATIVYDRMLRPIVRVGDPRAEPGTAASLGARLAAGSGPFHSSAGDATSRVWGLSRVEGTPYEVAYGSPGQSSYGAAESALRRDLAFATAAALAALAAAFLLAGRVTRPVVRRSAELHDSNLSLQAANDAKNEFLSRMSHELRTPLAAIMGFNELLTLSDLDEQRMRWAVTSLKSSRHLLALVNEVLDLARIEAGELSISPETVALRPLIEEAVEMMEPLARSREIALYPPTMPVRNGYVFADNQRLKQVLINLISNAIKYNREGGEVRIAVHRLPNDCIRLSVSDTGKGIDPVLLPKLFVPFERLGAAAAGIEGSGLGLALSRSLLEAMDGSIELTETSDHGSTFTINLVHREPVAVEKVTSEQHAVLAVRHHDADRRVLYIEDTAANVRLVEEILARRPGIQLMPAMMGQLGLDLARQHHPDLILLDLHLPDLDGADVLDQLTADPNTHDIPVIVLTADATRRQLERVLAAGARAYLTKPISVVELLETVDRYIPTSGLVF